MKKKCADCTNHADHAVRVMDDIIYLCWFHKEFFDEKVAEIEYRVNNMTEEEMEKRLQELSDNSVNLH